MTPTHRALISLSALGFALMAATPGWTATSKTEKPTTEIRTAKPAEKKTDAKKTASKTSSKKTEVAEKASKSSKKAAADEFDDARTVKTKGKTATGKEKAKIADAAPEKGAKKSKVSETAPKKATGKTKSELAEAKSGKKSKSELADALSSKKSGKKNSKKTEVADAAPAKTSKKAAVKVATVKAPAVVAAITAPKVDAPVVMNAMPVPYSLVAGQGTPIMPVALNTPLSPYDTALYQSAFTLIDKGDYTGADAQLAQVTDKRLMGYAQYNKLFSRGYTSTYEELMAWLADYGDQPMAMKVWGLAKRKKPDGAADPAFPSLSGKVAMVNGNAVQLDAGTTLSNSTPVARADAAAPASDTDLTPKSARSAYNNGQLAEAVRLGRKIGDHWVAGLASWRLKRYEDAMAEFTFVSSDPSTNAWTQSSGAYWAGRCAAKLGQKEQADTYFQLAASFPFTFYGLLAEARLGVTPAIALAQKGLPPTFSRDQRTALAASLTSDFSWTQTNARAQRLNALVQVGQHSEAQYELKTAIQNSSNNDERQQWLALGAKTHLPVNQLTMTDRLFDVSLYPMPDIAPKGGYTVDKALIFALARKESKFDASAHSYSGAYGLLQLMPATAALVEKDLSYNSKPKQLLTPGVNLRIGQNYILRLKDSNIVDGDLLRTIAAYNAGPRPVKDAVDSLGNDADSLLVMESIPVAQTRQYVEEVAANYWIYRQIMGKPSKTLAAAAADAQIIDLMADAPAPAVAFADK